MVLAMHEFFSTSRFIQTTSVVDMLSPDFNERMNYAYGILFMVSIIVIFFVIWTTILLILKFKGEEAGCASGAAFSTSLKNEDDLLDERGKSRESGSTCSEDFENNSSIESECHENSRLSSFQEHEKDRAFARYKKRARRSRVAFLLIWITSMTCVCVVLVFGFAPLKEATAQSVVYFSDIQELLNQVNSTTRTIDSAFETATLAIQATPLDFDDFCPNATNGVVLGVDLLGLVTEIKSEIADVEKDLSPKFSKLKQFVENANTALHDVHNAVEQTDNFLWIVPGMLLVVATLTTIAMLAVLLAWRNRSGKFFQKIMSHCVSPFLILVCFVCCTTALCAAVCTMVSGDACVGENGPDQAIQSILQRHELDSNSTVFNFFSSYTNGCKGPDPTQSLQDLESNLQNSIDTIWRHLSTLDSAGRSEVEAACGHSLGSQLESAQKLAKGLTSIRNALDSAAGSLQCDVVNPIYITAIHDGFCDEAAGGAAWTFLFLFFISITIMMMISLRSTWYYEFSEEKVFDESEIAENMVVNEHEEYLAYISKFKHEWQEYRGFNSGSLHNMSIEDFDGSESESEGDFRGAGINQNSSRFPLRAKQGWSFKDFDKCHDQQTFSFEETMSNNTDNMSFTRRVLMREEIFQHHCGSEPSRAISAPQASDPLSTRRVLRREELVQHHGGREPSRTISAPHTSDPLSTRRVLRREQRVQHQGGRESSRTMSAPQASAPLSTRRSLRREQFDRHQGGREPSRSMSAPHTSDPLSTRSGLRREEHGGREPSRSISAPHTSDPLSARRDLRHEQFDRHHGGREPSRSMSAPQVSDPLSTRRGLRREQVDRHHGGREPSRSISAHHTSDQLSTRRDLLREQFDQQHGGGEEFCLDVYDELIYLWNQETAESE